jgi:hypothetical protein
MSYLSSGGFGGRAGIRHRIPTHREVVIAIADTRVEPQPTARQQ